MGAAEPERRGERQRRRILEAAADVATAEGLEGLSIARLAREVSLSKSGVAAHFGSKQQLQLAAVARAAEGCARDVLARDAEPGLARTEALLTAWLDYVEHVPYRSGCFFSATGAEFAGRPGPVREAIAHHTASWIRTLERELRTAQRVGEIEDEPRLLAFQLHALVQEANLRRTLLDDPAAFDDARALAARTLSDARRPRGEER